MSAINMFYFIFSHILKFFYSPFFPSFFLSFCCTHGIRFNNASWRDNFPVRYSYALFLFVGQAAACLPASLNTTDFVLFLWSVSYAILNAIDTDLVVKTKTQSVYSIDVKLMKMRERKLNYFLPGFRCDWEVFLQYKKVCISHIASYLNKTKCKS